MLPPNGMPMPPQAGPGPMQGPPPAMPMGAGLPPMPQGAGGPPMDPQLLQLIMALMQGQQGQGQMPPPMVSQSEATSAYRGRNGQMDMPQVRTG